MTIKKSKAIKTVKKVKTYSTGSDASIGLAAPSDQPEIKEMQVNSSSLNDKLSSAIVALEGIFSTGEDVDRNECREIVAQVLNALKSSQFATNEKLKLHIENAYDDLDDVSPIPSMCLQSLKAALTVLKNVGQETTYESNDIVSFGRKSVNHRIISANKANGRTWYALKSLSDNAEIVIAEEDVLVPISESAIARARIKQAKVFERYCESLGSIIDNIGEKKTDLGSVDASIKVGKELIQNPDLLQKHQFRAIQRSVYELGAAKNRFLNSGDFDELDSLIMDSYKRLIANASDTDESIALKMVIKGKLTALKHAGNDSAIALTELIKSMSSISQNEDTIASLKVARRKALEGKRAEFETSLNAAIKSLGI